ncbi:157_t:CDS:2, partial [Racocetra fulgida]
YQPILQRISIDNPQDESDDEKGISIKNMNKSDGLTEQKIEIGGDVSVMISKNKNIRSSDSNQAGLEKKSAEENNIKSNKAIGEKNDHKLDNLEVEVDQLLLVMRNSNSEFVDVWCSNRTYNISYCDQEELTGDEIGVNKEISLIDFNESDQIDERKPKSIFDFKIDVVLEEEKIVEDLLKVLRDNDSNEFDCGMDLSK